MSAAETSALLAVCRPVADASGLPNRQYVSQEAFAEEKRTTLGRQWAGIGFGKDVPVPGDVYPIEFLGIPLLLVREESGAVAVFQNTCRHRGMVLVDAPMRVRQVIRCPYHSWCYGLDGALRATPHVGGPGCNSHPRLRRETLGLFRIRSAVWRDVIFVDLSGEAESFEACIESLQARWAVFDQPMRHGGDSSSFTLEVRGNWKLAVENYCESYHLPWIHPGLNSYSRLQDHYDILDPDAGAFSGQGTHVYRRLRTESGDALPDFDDLPSRWDEAAEYIAFYPNVLFGVHRDHAFAIVLLPLDVDRTRERIEIYYTVSAGEEPRFEAMRDTNAARWRTVFAEDIGVVEGMQRGRAGPRFDGGRFSLAMDRATHAFHRWVAQGLLATHLSLPCSEEGASRTAAADPAASA